MRQGGAVEISGTQVQSITARLYYICSYSYVDRDPGPTSLLGAVIVVQWTLGTGVPPRCENKFGY